MKTKRIVRITDDGVSINVTVEVKTKPGNLIRDEVQHLTNETVSAVMKLIPFLPYRTFSLSKIRLP